MKSPLFGLDDDDLLAIAPRPQGRAVEVRSSPCRAAKPALQARCRDAEALARAAPTSSPPFEFFAELLDRDGGRSRLLTGSAPKRPIRSTSSSNLALNYDDGAPPSLIGFLDWLRSGEREIKRDMEHGRDEVRVMTVHGAKGLEAPIVFLPDTCTTASGDSAGLRLLKLDRGQASRRDSGARRVDRQGHTDPDVPQAASKRIADRDTAERSRSALRRHDARPRPPLRGRF